MQAQLFTTTICPKCPAFKKFVTQNLKFPVKLLDEKSPDFQEQAAKLGVKSVPTLIIFDEAAKELFRFSEIPEVQEAMSKLQPAVLKD